MKGVIFLKEAKTELFEAIEYYEEKSPGLGLDFAKETKHSLSIISKFPECCALRNDGTRRYLLNRFPFLIIYIHRKNQIWIIAVAHCKRKPDYWIKRRSGDGGEQVMKKKEF